MKADLFGGLLLLVLTGAYFWMAETIPSSMLDDEFGPRGLPVALAAILAVLALVLIVRGLLALRRASPAKLVEAQDEEEVDHAAPFGRALAFLGIGVGYVLVLPYLGYPVSIALMVAAEAFYEGAPRDWRLPATAIFAGAFFWLVFNALLGVSQPSGLLF